MRSNGNRRSVSNLLYLHTKNVIFYHTTAVVIPLNKPLWNYYQSSIVVTWCKIIWAILWYPVIQVACIILQVFFAIKLVVDFYQARPSFMPAYKRLMERFKKNPINSYSCTEIFRERNILPNWSALQRCRFHSRLSNKPLHRFVLGWEGGGAHTATRLWAGGTKMLHQAISCRWACVQSRPCQLERGIKGDPVMT